MKSRKIVNPKDSKLPKIDLDNMEPDETFRLVADRIIFKKNEDNNDLNFLCSCIFNDPYLNLSLSIHRNNLNQSNHATGFIKFIAGEKGQAFLDKYTARMDAIIYDAKADIQTLLDEAMEAYKNKAKEQEKNETVETDA